VGGRQGLLIVKNSSACMPVDWQSSSECDACLSSPDSRRRLTFPRLSTAARLPPVPTITLWRATGGLTNPSIISLFGGLYWYLGGGND